MPYMSTENQLQDEAVEAAADALLDLLKRYLHNDKNRKIRDLKRGHITQMSNAVIGGWANKRGEQHAKYPDRWDVLTGASPFYGDALPYFLQ